MRPFFLSLCALGVLAGCASGRESVPAPMGTTTSTRALKADAVRSGTLFIAVDTKEIGEGADAVLILAPPYTQIQRVIGAIDAPVALALDAHGTMYVANFAGGSSGLGDVAAFPPPYTGTPSFVLDETNGVGSVSALKFDAKGDLFILSGYNPDPTKSTGLIEEFAPPISSASKPIAVIGCLPGIPGAFAPQSITLDVHGDLFVANASGNTVSVLHPPYATACKNAPVTIRYRLQSPNAVAVNHAGDLFVANQTSTSASVTEYTAPYTGSTNGYQGALSDAGITAVALDGAGELFVQGEKTFGVTPPYTQPSVIFPTIQSGQGLAVDAYDNVYVVDAANANVYRFAPPYHAGVVIAGSPSVLAAEATVVAP